MSLLSSWWSSKSSREEKEGEKEKEEDRKQKYWVSGIEGKYIYHGFRDWNKLKLYHACRVEQQ